MAAEVVADMADALHGDAQSLEARDAEAVLRGRLHAPVDAVGGGGRGIAGAARAGAGGVRGLARHDLDIGNRDADILRHGVAPAEAVDGAAHGAEQGFRLVAARSEEHTSELQSLMRIS